MSSTRRSRHHNLVNIVTRERSFSSISSDSANDDYHISHSSKSSGNKTNRDRRSAKENNTEWVRTHSRERDRSGHRDGRNKKRREDDRFDRYHDLEEESYLSSTSNLQGAHESKTETKEKITETKHDVDEMLDPSTCNFNSVYFAEGGAENDMGKMEGGNKHPNENINRLDRLEKLVEVLVNNTTKSANTQSATSATTQEVIQPLPIDEFIPRNTNFTTSMWINKIDEECILRNLDEKSCIQYMNSRMSGIMKAWFKTISSYDFTWPELKMLIIRTFPDNGDFASTLRLLVNRMKRPDETMIQYYFGKMYLLEACKITGTNAVSCLIDGLENPVLQEEARTYNFLTAEALYSQYFLKVGDYEFNQPQEEFAEIITYEDTYSVEPSPADFNYFAMKIGPRFNNTAKKKCFVCKKIGHIAADCRHAPLCYNCQLKGHIAAKCPLKTLPQNTK